MRLPSRQCLIAILAALLVPAASFGQGVKDGAAAEKTPTILFVCEHGAAKSVIAAAHFDKLAKQRGLKYRAISRGTNPDPALAPATVKGPQGDGISTQGWKPTLVTKKEMDAAAGIVTLGCALPEKDAVAGKLTEWNDVPSPSHNYQAARDDIVKRVQSLVDDLAEQERGAKRKQKAKP